MTDAQFDALVVLANVDPRESVGGWRRRSQLKPVPRVNNRAVDSLVLMRYAQAQLTLHGEEYRITTLGVKNVVREDERRRRAAA